MEKISAYKLSDGTVVTDRKEALSKERFLQVTKKLQDFAKIHMTTEGAENFMDLVMESSVREELLKILTTKEWHDETEVLGG